MADNFKHKNTDLTLSNDSGVLDLIRQYTEAYNKAYAEGDKAGQQAAHDAAEKIRAKYDYSGRGRQRVHQTRHGREPCKG